MRKTVFAICTAAALGFTASVAMAGPSKVTVEQVNQQMNELSGSQVELHGKVVKVNNGIMGRNFVHITDGTGSGDTAKVIVTTNDIVPMGTNVKAVGTVKLGTDFGMGYSYPLLVEQASVTVE